MRNWPSIAASLAAVGIPYIARKAGDARDFVACRRACCAEGRLKCAVNLVLLVISEVSGGATPENSIDGKFLELA